MTRLIVFFSTILINSVTITAQQKKLIIDCDPGIDDATALVLAMQNPGFEILGITTVFGNAYLDQCTKNALQAVELSGKNIPVYKGAEKPMSIPIAPPPDFIHGKDGLGKYQSTRSKNFL
jgi:inosine-uridine nucleoside N-ribohydrolase